MAGGRGGVLVIELGGYVCKSQVILMGRKGNGMQEEWKGGREGKGRKGEKKRERKIGAGNGKEGNGGGRGKMEKRIFL